MIDPEAELPQVQNRVKDELAGVVSRDTAAAANLDDINVLIGQIGGISEQFVGALSGAKCYHGLVFYYQDCIGDLVLSSVVAQGVLLVQYLLIWFKAAIANSQRPVKVYFRLVGFGHSVIIPENRK